MGLRLPPLRCSDMKVALGVGRDAPSARESASLSIIPGIDIVSGNGTRHDRNSGHCSLVEVDLRAKCL